MQKNRGDEKTNFKKEKKEYKIIHVNDALHGHINKGQVVGVKISKSSEENA